MRDVYEGYKGRVKWYEYTSTWYIYYSSLLVETECIINVTAAWRKSLRPPIYGNVPMFSVAIINNIILKSPILRRTGILLLLYGRKALMMMYWTSRVVCMYTLEGMNSILQHD